jgi:hypothetical protein
LWNNATDAGAHVGTARKRAVAWLALRIRDELAEHERYSTLVEVARSRIEWLDVAEHFFFEFDPTEDCWPRWSIEMDEARENVVLEPLKKERQARDGEPLVQLGMCVYARHAIDELTGGDIKTALGRHANADWGEVCRETWEENDIALREGFQLRSVYRGKQGTEFWVITEADRSMTTVLLPLKD